MVDVEIAVQDVAGVRVARAAGADRVELCIGLVTGGLTPPIGLVAAAVETGLPVHPLVRTRPGGFVHDADELAAGRVEPRVDGGGFPGSQLMHCRQAVLGKAALVVLHNRGGRWVQLVLDDSDVDGQCRWDRRRQQAL